MIQSLHLYLTTGRTIALTIWTFVSQVISLLFIMLSRFVITSFPKSKHLLISWLQSLSTVILELKKIKFVTAFTISNFSFHELMGPDDLSLFFMLSFKPAFSLSSLPLIKRLFNYSSRLLIFLLAILIPACDSSSLAFCMMYSVYK